MTISFIYSKNISVDLFHQKQTKCYVCLTNKQQGLNSVDNSFPTGYMQYNAFQKDENNIGRIIHRNIHTLVTK